MWSFCLHRSNLLSSKFSSRLTRKCSGSIKVRLNKAEKSEQTYPNDSDELYRYLDEKIKEMKPIKMQSNLSHQKPSPIQSLQILERIETYKKPGSVFLNYCLGKIDIDLLSFPFLLKSRKEFLTMYEQYEMVRNTWNQIKKDDDTLHLLRYDRLYELSISEMMMIFEAMGASVEKNLPFGIIEDDEARSEKRMSKSFNYNQSTSKDTEESAFRSFSDIRESIRRIVPIIEKNAIIHYALKKSPNENLKSILESKAKIAFAYDEDYSDRIDVSVNGWRSEAKLNRIDNCWVISGEKNSILENDYSHYMIFCKTNDFVDVQTSNRLNNDVGAVAVLVPADSLQIEPDGLDYFGLQRQKIRFNLLQLDRNEYEVINASKNIFDFNNTKGCGMLATSAVILGLLKQLQRNTYANLVNNRIGMTNCEIVQYKLFQTTCKIYSIESMLYLTAAMFDSFERGIDIGSESIATKTLTIEYAFDIITELRSLFGARYPFSSLAYDLIFYLDSFLDSTFNNRLLLAKNCARHYTNFEEILLPNNLNFYIKWPIYSLKNHLKQRKLRKYETKLTREITKYIHHNMHSACDWIEHSVNLAQFSIYYLKNLHKEEILERQADLNRLVTIMMDIHLMISCLSRANHSLCYGFRNNHTEKELCLAICKEIYLKHLDLFESIDKRAMVDNDEFSRNVFETNLTEHGYFPKLFQI
ncbi:poly(U)-binding-splicing factor [Sarcoptes scabiei]|nr:poly(U)-binding-splicing factor [Sarcoptes scabiei]